MVKAVSEGMGNTWSWLSESHPMDQGGIMAEVFTSCAEVQSGPPTVILEGPVNRGRPVVWPQFH